ncbi:hypothetical protein [Micromonospora sp. WMMD736]|uniref:hypothetical protein n=1 Tax=Micromonospora sp. WMMD736 TaxID=3404112 RepID=UPI003B928E42
MLRAITRTAISIRPVVTLDKATLDRMWALYAPHHNMTRSEFEDKLATLDEVALFIRRKDRALIGFCGLRHLVVRPATGRPVATFYMGLTYLEPEFRSSGLTQWMVVRRVLGPLLSPRFGRVYFWCDCLTYRPYLAMARNLGEYYPCPTRATSDEVLEVITTLGKTYYGDCFDEQFGTVRKPLRRINEHEAHVSAADVEDPDISFYLERNPGYDRGDGLIAICPMGVRNLAHLFRRQLRKGLFASPKQPAPQLQFSREVAPAGRSVAAV